MWQASAFAPGVAPAAQTTPNSTRAHFTVRRRRRNVVAWYRPAAVAFDAAVVAIPFGLVLGIANEPAPAVGATVATLLWLLVRAARRRYRDPNLTEYKGLSPVLRDWLTLVGTLAVLRAVTGESYHFPLALSALAPCVPLTVGHRALLRHHLLTLRRNGQAVRRTLVVGEAGTVEGLVSQMARHTDHEFVTVGVCTFGGQATVSTAPVTAQLGEQSPAGLSADSAPVLETARRLDADVVFVVPGPGLTGDRLRRLAWDLHGDGRPLAVLPGLSDVARHRLDVSSAAGLTLLHIAPPIRRGPAVALKSAIDRMGAMLLIALLMPVFAVVAAAVRLDSPGTVLHHQVRVGRGGRPFTMWKFRSMVSNAEQLRQELADANERDGRLFKIRRDPRVTRVGRILRRYSLDELPQLFNVLRGHMSLVGPRPPLPDEVARYNDIELRRLTVKPGLTGLWQVSGRSDLSWEETVALDLRYVDNWSPSMDLGVLVRTFRAVVAANGAY